MPERQYKMGVCTDGKRHASVRSLFQRNALCGAGRIVFKVDGWFDSEDLLACPKCAQLLREDPEGTTP
jgi:hypothetical protein